MKIHLPNSAFIGNIDPFISSIKTSNDRLLEITSHPHWVSVHPVVLCMIASLGIEINQRGGKIVFHKMSATSKHYLERMGLFKYLDLDSEMTIHSHESSGRFIPLININDIDKVNTFITDMIPCLHKEPKEVEPIKYVLSELVRNVFEHANSPMGAVVCAQFYRDSNIIRIGVVDRGIGLKASLERYHPANNDADAIKLALTPGITGTTNKVGGTATNAGAGLFFIKSIAKVNRDFFMLYSGTAMYKLLKTPSKNKQTPLFADPLQDNHSIKENLPFWQGTVAGIDFSLGSHEKFDALLGLIREVYRKSRIERTKQKYRGAKFI